MEKLISKDEYLAMKENKENIIFNNFIVKFNQAIKDSIQNGNKYIIIDKKEIKSDKITNFINSKNGDYILHSDHSFELFFVVNPNSTSST